MPRDWFAGHFIYWTSWLRIASRSAIMLAPFDTNTPGNTGKSFGSSADQRIQRHSGRNCMILLIARTPSSRFGIRLSETIRSGLNSRAISTSSGPELAIPESSTIKLPCGFIDDHLQDLFQDVPEAVVIFCRKDSYATGGARRIAYPVSLVGFMVFTSFRFRFCDNLQYRIIAQTSFLVKVRELLLLFWIATILV
ncbi:MAG: hypothetical protein UX14_C0019G0003 [Parcubacteria group bacterium GW2011_GWF1_45_5]|nr:MAG: hypothetical protein UX14_C0019G0003 [Parcubacteria group bacterium GW2011_GWF1_45_5]